MSILTRVLAFYSGAGDDDERSMLVDKPGYLLSSQGLPAYAELARRGNGYSAMNTSALAALVVRPSTVANFTLFNNNRSGGPSFIMDRAFAFNLVSTAAQAKQGMWLCVHPPGLASVAAGITTAASGNTGKKLVTSAGGTAYTITAMTVTDDGWFPWGPWSDVEPTGVLPGAIMTVNIEGRLIVPPQCGISTQVVSSVVGNTFTSGFSWYVEQLDIL